MQGALDSDRMLERRDTMAALQGITSEDLQAIMSGSSVGGSPLEPSPEVLANMAAARAGYKSVQDASDALVDGLYASLNSDRVHHPQVPMGPALPPPGSHAFQMLLRQPIPIPKLFTASRAQQQQQGPGSQAQAQMQPPQQADASSSGAHEQQQQAQPHSPAGGSRATAKRAANSSRDGRGGARSKAQQASSSDSGDADAGDPHDRRAVLKEKNRRAQKRFRDRQRTKLVESEGQVSKLSSEVEALRSENARLQNRNGILEKVLELKEGKEGQPRQPAPQAGISGQDSMETDPAVREAIAAAFNVKQELYFTVREGHSMTMSVEAVRRMPQKEIAGLWRSYVEALARCMVQADGDATCPAGQRLGQLVQEAVALQACMAMMNPKGALTWQSRKMDSTRGDSTDDPPANLWSKIMRDLNLSKQQRADLNAARREYLAELGTNIKERQEVLDILHECLPSGNGGKQTAARYLQSLDAMGRLHENMREQHSFLMRFIWTAARSIMSDFQGATCIVQSHPWCPDMLNIVNAMAEQDGELAAGEVRITGSKGHRQLLEAVLPKLCLYEVVPATLVAQLLQLLATTDEARVVRFVYYLLQLLLGIGSAGTPSPAAGDLNVSAALQLPAEIVGKAWADAGRPSDAGRQRLAMRALTAAARGTDGEKAVLQAVDAALARADQEEPAFMPEKKRKGQVAGQEGPELQHSAFVAARAAIKGPAATQIAVRGFAGITSPDPIGARHALALVAAAARKDAAKVVAEQKELPALVNGAISQYESSGLTLGAQQPKKTSPDKARIMGSNLNFADMWGRVYLARLCSALIFAEWTSTQTFVEGLGAPFLKMLAALATRQADADTLVSLEGIKALVGHHPPLGPGLTAQSTATPQEELMGNRMCIRAWSMVVAQASTEIVYVPGAQPEEAGTLAGAIGARIREGLASTSAALVCGAARAAAAIAESHARAVAAQVLPRSLRGQAGRLLQMLEMELLQVLEGPYSAAERCAALEALFWLQVMRAVPKASRALLESASAIIAAAPSRFKGDQLAGTWTTALQLGPFGRVAALQAALEFIGTSAPPIATVSTGASMQAIGKAAAEEAAWAKLQRSAAWWLGEYGNVAAEESSGSIQAVRSAASIEAALQQKTSAAELMALQALRNPPMAAVLSHLQHTALTQPWSIRVAAVQSIAKIAVRSEEPYRLQAYTVLRGLAGTDARANPDAAGLASVVLPAVHILDGIYAARVTIEALKQRYGMENRLWPESVVESLRDRHNQIFKQIEEHIGALPANLYYPLGPKSKALLQGGGLEEIQVIIRPPPEEKPELLEAPKVITSPFAAGQQEPKPAEDDSENESAISRTESELREVQQAERALPEPQQSEVIHPLPSLDLGNLDALQRELDRKVESTWAQPLKPYEPWKEFVPRQPDVSDDEEPQPFPMHARKPSLELNFDEVAATPRAAPDQTPINQRGVVQFFFDGAMDEELTVDQGEELEVQHEVDGWYQVVNRAGATGLVPASFIRLLAAGEASPAAVGAAGAAFSIATGPLPQESWRGFAENLEEPTPKPFGQPWGDGASPPSASARHGHPQAANAFASGSFDDFEDEPPVRVGGSFRIPAPVQTEWQRSSPTAQHHARPAERSESAIPERQESSPMAQQFDRPAERSDTAAALPSRQSVEAAVMPSKQSIDATSAAVASGSNMQAAERAGSGVAASPWEQEAATLGSQASPEASSGLPASTVSRLAAEFDELQHMDIEVDRAQVRLDMQEPQSPVAQSAFASAPSLASSTFDAAAEQAPAPAVGQPASIPARFDSFGTQYDDFGASPAARPQSRTAFEAENDEEISVDAQQEVMVEAEVDGWYQVVRGSERGLVPASYVQVL
eukprot:jgi/Astpho2/8567/fgenesh1_pg.00125_%23_57_t